MKAIFTTENTEIHEKVDFAKFCEKTTACFRAFRVIRS
ncbi:hypothetical protein CYK57_01096 [Actinobacillus pleuropneumoniae]|nr:hypothetical protein appser2_9040 [Actinobacillus pleuropneumoniae serovar 2 str. S1536]EFM89900.1 hypothetical protein appser4_9590 [Actinobacillus pleuropneumoniae serovar 4 str. M62]EFM94153.1 hypothetical protein appser9_10520 [Actinobacillus pleuropneumoniae serovar 9 str. CVJ13261]EFM96374.1 hypothetical protein appser10_9850 [Actinobacillus pleuropneumoniae serovar 10 str. D13039]EFM98482.1 hypothetical protein appser11_10530 [Actinobacillus pleuropneumoniae serovar 11 str. 56153]EFN